jgi:hypothetical protein
VGAVSGICPGQAQHLQGSSYRASARGDATPNDPQPCLLPCLSWGQPGLLRARHYRDSEICSYPDRTGNLRLPAHPAADGTAAAGRGRHTNGQIAGRLGLSEATVCTHLENIYGRLQVSSRTAAVLRVPRQDGAEPVRVVGPANHVAPQPVVACIRTAPSWVICLAVVYWSFM